ncbi:uncharacterized protein LOC135494952 [Lineus longissimus]|uniref:uncharacterized protein LOC135494952 n=1 Tax=Lineus longissimus TaxID=88925 RepID=UPI00315CD132
MTSEATTTASKDTAAISEGTTSASEGTTTTTEETSATSEATAEASVDTEVTVVTAYFDLGSFEKGSPNNVFTKQKYYGWMKTFQNIQNPLVGYFDTNETFNVFKKLRAHLPANHTRLFLVERSQLWSFSLRDQINEIFKNPSYPKFSPNTVLPEYSCAMHAKYEVMNTTIKNNYFKTKYFCWLDIGLFRSISENTDAFTLGLPKGFDPTHIAYQEVSPRNSDLDPGSIFRGNLYWVCGCFFLGEKGLMLKWTQLYKDYVVKYLTQGLMNTDQQIIYAMFSTHGNQPRPAIELQLFKPDGRFNPWFSLGYLSKEAGQRKNS